MYHNVVGLYKRRLEYMTVRSSHIDPHFLSNAGAAIQALIRSDPKSAGDYVAKFFAFLIETQQNTALMDITIENELLHLHHYMEFQQLRFKEQIRFCCTVPSSVLEYSLPPRSLQTLVENALTHGRSGLTRPLFITITGKDTDKRIILTVQDNGCGIASDRLALLTKEPVESEYSNGTALYYLQKTLDLTFESAKLTIHSTLHQGTTVTLSIPKEIVK